MASPSKVVDVTISPVAKKKKENPRKWKGAAVYKCSNKNEWSNEYPVLMEIHTHSTAPLARRTFNVNIKVYLM